MSEIVTDGRVKRSVRSRKTIIEAMLALIEEGNYNPTAQQVADKAVISIRTVFRHFSEMELLYSELDDVLRPAYEKSFSNEDFSGTQAQRIQRIVNSRTTAYLENYHMIKASHTLLWRWDSLRTTYLKNQLSLRKILVKMLPELKMLSKNRLEMADAIMSFEYFDRLYTYQGVSVTKCKKLLAEQLADLLDS